MAESPKNSALDEENTQGSQDPPDWSRRQFLFSVGAVTVAGLIGTFGGSTIARAMREVFGSQVETGNIPLYALDYYYIPNYMTWQVGDRITIAFRNRSQSHPGKYHEWVVGRHVNTENTVFGVETQDGFAEDFFDGVHVTLSNPRDVNNFVPNKAIVTYEGPKSLYNIADGGNFSPTLNPGGAVDITFTVPDKPGLWNYGCFVQHYEHYRMGMRGTINIVRA
ncbi:hypothetical protein [Ferroacidibacillus organovorans]|uniref:Blue (type 1) copper domain-containing protein n=1 Tax=Ferroacidibacillus organovorans TaxID=1765683 RepID=A0A124IWA9_9BACL|nr:hypothetical protein [Ferroacidibacillus organovorans]KUO96829.1 hypothetical protein ATW55_08450 [Ferroacidibacillus organovorans]